MNLDTLLHEQELGRQKFREQWSLLGLSLPSILVVVLIIVIPVGWLFYLSVLGGWRIFPGQL